MKKCKDIAMESDVGNELRLKGVIPYVDRIYARTAPETAEALREAVEEAGEKVSFVPELAEAPAEGFDETGYLVLS